MFPIQMSPTWNFPWSGDVTQDIDPYFGVKIEGVPEVERAVVRDVASYGKQLGKVIEALRILSAKSGAKLPEIDELYDKIEKVKTDEIEALRRRAEEALSRLEKVDKAAYARVMRR